MDDLLEERLNTLTYNYDLDGVIAVSEEEPQGDVHVWRQTIMESGFMALYSYAIYDQMCGKLGEGGLDFIDDVIDAAETFCGRRCREWRAEVLCCRMEEIVDTNPEQAKIFALATIEELSPLIPDSIHALKFSARMYNQLANLDYSQALSHWLKAVEYIRISGEFDLWILYREWDQPIAGMPEAQQREREAFQQRMAKKMKAHPNLVWALLDSGIRILEYTPLPELRTLVDAWLQAANSWSCEHATSEQLRDAGMIMHKQGNLMRKPEYLRKAIECFEHYIACTPAHGMEVNYLSNVWQDWAHMSEAPEYEERLMTAWEVYRKHEEIVSINFSPLLHYAEFLEQLYFNDKISRRPSRDEVLKWALESEKMGNGYYSGPGMIQARLAISEHDPNTAIYHLCRLLLGHELCIDDLIKNLRESLTDKVHPEIRDFLDQTLRFMDDVDEGYFYDPAFTYEDLNKLTTEETLRAWQKRMATIRNRNNDRR